jgi:hypothetical protein
MRIEGRFEGVQPSKYDPKDAFSWDGVNSTWLVALSRNETDPVKKLELQNRAKDSRGKKDMVGVGDSGGPVFQTIRGVTTMVGVNSSVHFSDNGEVGYSTATRITFEKVSARLTASGLDKVSAKCGQ